MRLKLFPFRTPWSSAGRKRPVTSLDLADFEALPRPSFGVEFLSRSFGNQSERDSVDIRSST